MFEQKKQVKTAVAILLLLTSLSGASFIHSVNAENQWEQLFGPVLPSVWIYSNGTFASTDLPIQQDGNVYYLTGDFYKHAIHIDCDNVVVDGRNFLIKSDGSLGGVAIGISARNVTVKNFVIDKVPVGISFYGTAGLVGEEMEGTIINNTISNCNVAVKFWGESSNSIRENILENNKKAIEIKGAYYSEGAHFSRGYACFNSVENNIIRYNDEGVHLEDANQSSVCHNVIAQNGYGAYLNDVDGTVFLMNDFQSNNCGVYIIAPSSNNEFHQNNFDDNSESVTLQEKNQTQNSWDNGFVGNYWSDYNGSAGVYKLDENNIDHYPLSQPIDIYAQPINATSGAPTHMDNSTPKPINTETLLLIGPVSVIVIAIVSVLLIRWCKRKPEKGIAQNTF